MKITVQQVKDVLVSKEMRDGLLEYAFIMNKFHIVDVSKDNEFQRKFKYFYKIRQKSKVFYDNYFCFLEENKTKVNIDFEIALRFIYDKTNEIHKSFCSKLVSVINPDKPLIDKFVLKNLGYKDNYYGLTKEEQIKQWTKIYDSIINWYSDFLLSAEAKIWLNLFKSTFPNAILTDVKKIDFILFNIR